MKTSDVLSIIAIIISILAVSFEYYYTFRINKNALMSIYYSDTFKKYLTDLIPNARTKISYNRNTKFLACTDELENIILDMRQESLYFKYQKATFYSKLIEILNIIDDLLVTNGNSRLSEYKYNEFEKNLDNAVAKVYKIINDNYIGRS